jgi:hypothetical protein
MKLTPDHLFLFSPPPAFADPLRMKLTPDP